MLWPGGVNDNGHHEGHEAHEEHEERDNRTRKGTADTGGNSEGQDREIPAGQNIRPMQIGVPRLSMFSVLSAARPLLLFASFVSAVGRL